jgi:UDP-2-acetamido-2,6-beta-L-arabino-hexul-4-ose reductase
MGERKIVAVTGADGFVGKNLTLRLQELARFDIRPITRSSTSDNWAEALDGADAAVHLAGVNRPQDPAEFEGNFSSAQQLAQAIEQGARRVPVILASSARAVDDSPYGASKRAAEEALLNLAERTGSPVAVFRLPNVFGKWCRPNYNSGVATFCHNIARGLPISVNDPSAPLTLVYIDDVVDTFVRLIDDPGFDTGVHEVQPVYEASVGSVADAIRRFREDRDDNLIANVGTGLTRALYATYVSYLPVDSFAYPIASHRDPRGAFSEMLKTREAGQFSYFTAHPGVTRGGHYHHTKTEKFLIVHGQALFRFRHMLTGQTHEVRTSGEEPVVVETVPGWTHDVTNVGEEVMVSMLWANELFDRERPDTIAEKV